jgi:CRP-like cAMP-binding protein
MSRSGPPVSSFLERIPLFAELAPAELERITAQAMRIPLTRGVPLFRMGDEPQGFYVVVHGQIKLTFASPRGDEKIVEVIGPGQSFGEAVMFVPRPYPVSATALGDALVVFVGRAAVFDELERDSRFAARVIAGLCRRIHGLMADLEATTMHTGTQRVIGFLLRDSRDDPASDVLQVTLPVSKSVIASRLSITQEHFSRILHDLSAHGLLEVEGRTIRVPSVERLQAYRP